MPTSAAREALNCPAVGIFRMINENDEAMTSSVYSTALHNQTERVFTSMFWQNKARFAQARRELESTVFLRPGGNTYLAEIPNQLARTLAGRVLNALECFSLPPARLTASADGGVGVSFVEGGNRAVIEIYNTGEIAAATYSLEGNPAVWELDDTDARLRETIAQIRVHLAA